MQLLSILSLAVGVVAQPMAASLPRDSQTIENSVSILSPEAFGPSPLTYPAAQCAPAGYPAGKISKVTIKPDESKRDRTYHVYVPSTYNNTVAVPMILNYAGLNAPCDDIFKILKPAADARGHVLVTLCGSNGLIGTAWNSGTCCYFEKTKVDDYKFTTDVLADVQSKLCVDTNRIWAAGFSNGAMMVETLACKMANIFRAVASVSGIVEVSPGNNAGLDKCDSAVAATGAARTSVLNVHGTADPLVPFPGDPVLGFPSVEKDIERWVARNGCNPNGTQTFHRGEVDNMVYSQCANNGSIELVRHHGGHTWPSTKDLDTTSYVQEFFDRVSQNI